MNIAPGQRPFTYMVSVVTKAWKAELLIFSLQMEKEKVLEVASMAQYLVGEQ